MAKNAITDYSQTAADNTDIGGNSLLGSSSPRNLLLGLRELMKQLADWNAGTSPIDDTASSCDPTDTTKVFRFDGANVPTATTRVIDAEALYDISQAPTDVVDVAARRGAPTLTYYTTAGAHTHTFDTDSKYFQVFGIGGGGAGGNVDGQGGGAAGSASGGNSGHWGWTAFLTKGAITTGTIAVGAGGAVGAGATDNGGDGGNTTWSDGTNSFTWPGGKGGISLAATSSATFTAPVANAAPTGTIYGAYSQGSHGINNGNVVMACPGGGTPCGQGVAGSTGTSGVVNGQAGGGFGSGGGGAAAKDTNSNATGGAGRLGLMIVVEW